MKSASLVCRAVPDAGSLSMDPDATSTETIMPASSVSALVRPLGTTNSEGTQPLDQLTVPGNL